LTSFINYLYPSFLATSTSNNNINSLFITLLKSLKTGITLI